jgi:hypothetical protein
MAFAVINHDIASLEKVNDEQILKRQTLVYYQGLPYMLL